MRSLAVINRRRRDIRKWMLIAILPITLLVLLYGVKVVSMNIFADKTVSSFTNNDMTVAQQNSERQKFANFLEEWKAYYNNGTTLLALGAYEDSIKDLEKALELRTEPTEQCDIRANLALSYEGYGDGLITDKKFDDAQIAYDSAIKVLDEADESCSNEQENPEASASIEETKERLQGKGEDEPVPAEPEPSDEQKEEIQKQLDENNADKTETDSGDPSNTQGDYQGGSSSEKPESVDKPW